VTNNGQAAELLRNDGGNRGNALVIKLVGTTRQPRRDRRACAL
jgi:hypothetical protein